MKKLSRVTDARNQCTSTHRYNLFQEVIQYCTFLIKEYPFIWLLQCNPWNNVSFHVDTMSGFVEVNYKFYVSNYDRLDEEFKTLFLNIRILKF